MTPEIRQESSGSALRSNRKPNMSDGPMAAVVARILESLS
jgi:hypothetical protein